MTLYRQVNGRQVLLTEEESARVKQSWQNEQKRLLTEGLDERTKCLAGDSYRLIELLWNGVAEGKIPGKDTEFFSCIAEAKAKAESEVLKDTGMTKEEFEAARQEILGGETHETL